MQTLILGGEKKLNKIGVSLMFAVGISILLEVLRPEIIKIGTIIRENPFEIAILIGLVVVIAMLKYKTTKTEP